MTPSPDTGVSVSGSGRVVVSTATLGGAVPDGLCADAGGRLWVALAETGAVGVFSPDPETGGTGSGAPDQLALHPPHLLCVG